MHCPDPMYSAVSVRETKYTYLGYRTRISRLHTLDPPFSISFFEEQSFCNTHFLARIKFCANRSAYKNAYQIIVLVKNLPKIILHRMHCMAWHIIFF
jgi:hypothetical protein